MFQKFTVLILFLFLTPLAHATRVNRPPPNLNPWQHEHFISFVIDNWKYKEPDIAIRDSGILLGVNYAYRNVFESLFYEANFEYLQGVTRYEGFSFTGQPASFDQSNRIGMAQLWLGVPRSAVWGHWSVMPKVGFLFRYLIDADDPAGGDYERRQQYLALPLGLDVFCPTSHGLFVFQIYVPVLFRGKNTTVLTDVGASNDATVDQDDGNGFHVGLDYIRGLWTVGGFWRMWYVGDSDTAISQLPANPPSGFLEPRNETLSLGLKVGVAF